MNHLKSFNESNKEYYWEIKTEEYWEKEFYVTNISQKTIETINSFNIEGILDKFSGGMEKFAFFFGKRLNRCVHHAGKDGRYDGFIREYKDEWFIVSLRDKFRRKFYLCDQLEGLNKFLISLTFESSKHCNSPYI